MPNVIPLLKKNPDDVGEVKALADSDWILPIPWVATTVNNVGQ